MPTVDSAGVGRIAPLPISGASRLRLLPALVLGCLCCLLVAAPPGEAAAPGQVEVAPTGAAPALAANPADGEFLAVWSEGESPWADEGVVGRRLGSDGWPRGLAFVIAAAGRSPAVAFDAQRHRFLVVWLRGTEIHGRLLSARGRPLAGPFLVGSARFGSPSQVAVAYNAIADRYLVSWVMGDSRLLVVSGRQLSGTAAPLGDGDRQLGGGCAVSVAASAREAQWLLAITSGCHARTFPGGISAVRIGLDGPQGQPAGGMGPLYDLGTRAGVAYGPSPGEYLVAWWTGVAREPSGLPPQCPPQGCRPPGVYGQRLEPGGEPVGADALPIRQWDPEQQPSRRDVAAAAVARSGRYLVVWEHGAGDAPLRSEIFGQRLNPDGTAVAPHEFRISTLNPLGAAAARPVVAAGRRTFLVAWQRRSGGIFARRVRAAARMPTERAESATAHSGAPDTSIGT